MSHPYSNAPSYARWSSAVRRPALGDVDPVVEFPFTLSQDDRIVTAGSCFAQHIARYLGDAGYNHHIVEKGHPVLPKTIRDAHQYGIFSARYGNIYTARQLKQLIMRSYGDFEPQEPAWQHGSVWVDPFRPTIQPGGFINDAELCADRKLHLEMVRRAIKEAEYFIFTLGLTEAWECTRDGAILPLCPGIEGGEFDKLNYRFVNFNLTETIEDLNSAFEMLRQENPNLKIILTVSPVPLAATAENRHVLVSTTLSKAILRLAAEEIVKTNQNIAYFPSYEIITGIFNRGSYFAKDLRSVTEDGVAHVMDLFFKHATDSLVTEKKLRSDSEISEELDEAAMVAEVLCDERLLDMN